MVTFGQMIEVANAHLAEVHAAFGQPDITTSARHPATTAGLARLTHTLTRYTERIAAGFGIPDSHGTGVRDAARRSSALLHQAQQHLGEPTWTENTGLPLSENLRGASMTLGCGLDLLDTHFTQAQWPGQTPSASATVIATTDTARALLHLLSSHIATAGQLALRAGPDQRQAGTLLIQAAVLARTHGTQDALGVTAIPFRHTPHRLTPTGPEERATLLAGIDASVHRLNTANTHDSVTTWRYLAQAAAITHDISHRLVWQLARRTRELGHEETAQELFLAQRSLRQLGGRWRTIAKHLNSLTSQYRDPATGPAIDGSDLVLRLGRLTYADPSWQPRPRTRSLAVVPPERIAADLPEVRQMALAALKAIDACTEIARRHQDAVNNTFIAHTLQRRPRTSDKYTPADEVGFLRRFYGTLHEADQRALAELSQAVQHLPVAPAESTDEVALIHRHATASRAPAANGRHAPPTAHSAPAIAAADFPTPISQTLTAPLQGTSTRAPTPNGAPQHHPRR